MTIPELAWDRWRVESRRAPAPLVDVRSPLEVARGAVPTALSLPLLDDSERAAVGTLYAQVGRLAATTAGLTLFAAKAERMVAAAIAALPDGGRIYVHCWRGGMRSQLAARWLRALGWAPTVLAGGYKAYRTAVLGDLAALARQPLLVLDGYTGAGKSELLRALEPSCPTVDFERFARHRGSAFGDFAQAEPAPSQQTFENLLAERYVALSAAPCLVVEIESILGAVRLPIDLQRHVYGAPAVVLTRDFDDRVERLAAEYSAGWTDDDDARFGARCALLRRHVAQADLDQVAAAVGRRDFRDATALLLRLRYDKIYERGLSKRQANVVARFNLTHEFPAAERFVRTYVSDFAERRRPAGP